MSLKFIRSRIAHFKKCDAAWRNAFEYIDDAIIAIEDGKISRVIHAEQAESYGIRPEQVIDKRPGLMMPGFIDAHVHSPQLPVMAAYGEQLLDWLEKYTFPAEKRCAELDYSVSQSEQFIDSLMAHGTTSAFIFTTSFAHNTQHVFDAAYDKNMRVVAGKVLMDRHAPEGLLDKEAELGETMELISTYHGKGRLGYALTPRFSPTSSSAQLRAAGEVLNEIPDLWMQTHLSENKAEIDWVKSLFPDTSDYLNTYETHGLHSEKSVYAHCIHISQDEIQRMADAGSTVAFCPSSNLFLGSGLADLQAFHDAGLSYALASDVGAGTSLSMLETMGDAYKVAQLQNYSLSPLEAFYSASLGAARALALDSYIGNFEVGKEADYIIIDARLNSHIARRLEYAKNIEEELFIYMIMGDDRIIQETGIAGKAIYVNPLSKGAMH